MMALHGERLVDRPFVERVAAVAKHVVEPRNVFLADAGRSGAYDFTKEPFSVRPKDFSPLPGTEKFVRDFIPKLTHECDGLIFQPSHARYENGTMASLLKWKFTHLNSVDFLLKLRWRPGSRPAPALYVGGEGETSSRCTNPAERSSRAETTRRPRRTGDPRRTWTGRSWSARGTRAPTRETARRARGDFSACARTRTRRISHHRVPPHAAEHPRRHHGRGDHRARRADDGRAAKGEGDGGRPVTAGKSAVRGIVAGRRENALVVA